MRHFDYLLEDERAELFSIHPLPINRSTEKEVLAHALGATLYMPAMRATISQDVMTKKHEGLISMVICLEDAIGDHEVPEAEQSLIRQVRDISSQMRHGLIHQDDIPIMFVRVRDVAQMNRIVDELQEDLICLTGFVFPKFTSRNAEEYLEALESCNRHISFPVYGMPILESADVIYKETRTAELLSIKNTIDKYRHLVLNVRMGATDFSSLFGLRRGPDVSIYDISTIRDCIGDIVNMFTRQGSEHVVSGPVWEYFGTGERLLKPQLRQSPFEQKLGGSSGRRLRQQLLNHWQDGLIKEVLLDKENGLTGKTIIHPSHIKIVHSLAVITREEYEDACTILQSQTNGVTKSQYANKMNEIKPHTSWAKKIMIKSKVYGVFHEHNNFINLLARTSNIQLQYSR
ncbi:HpcH/HpaI aldolase/citrate lyase family protein [Brevibacillus parabrevis]|jgi:Citrate lyase beta subunit|uniref:HpcH/HpaI aldolase/citrate lyase family protein n=1 Tax=Brevibacillus parabrevis TaxID=54914 RepID=UPI002493AB38|nr:HpcH/HpaI aldolase/citrate lyase family protein [Brevibacillus parabrevis]MDR4997434.1 HpcH/HpaI aldolase/citrate lyase family protein [Brevibacillus parabrevis]